MSTRQLTYSAMIYLSMFFCIPVHGQDEQPTSAYEKVMVIKNNLPAIANDLDREIKVDQKKLDTLTNKIRVYDSLMVIYTMKKDPGKSRSIARELAQANKMIAAWEREISSLSNNLAEFQSKSIQQRQKLLQAALFKQFGTVGTQGGTSTLSSNSFSVSQSAIIDGTAKFLAERFKNDATALYISSFKSKLEEIKGLKELFPATYDFLQTTDYFDYRSLGNEFKEVFEKDLKALLSHIKEYVEGNPTVFPGFKASEFYLPFLFAIDVSDKLINNYHPNDIFAFLVVEYKQQVSTITDATLKDEYQKYLDFIKVLDIMQRGLQVRISDAQARLIEYRNTWIKFEDLKKLDFQDMALLAGFMYDEDPELFASMFNGTPQEVIQKMRTNLFPKVIVPALTALDNIENILAKKDKLQGDDYADLMNNFIEIVAIVNNAIPKPVLNDADIRTAKQVVSVYQSIYKKDYASVVSNGTKLLSEFLRFGKVKADSLNLIQALSKYGSFMVSIAKADDSDDVKEAIKNNVTKFTYLDKRNSIASLTVSAHPGVIFSGERLTSSGDWKANLGVTAPIGFDLTFGLHRKANGPEPGYKKYMKNGEIHRLRGSYWGLFLSFADIGAVFNYRLNDTDSELPQELTFKQIFSPGASIQLGLRKTPITIGLGVQYTPLLRNISESSGPANSVRVGLRISWDIPLIKIAAQTEARK